MARNNRLSLESETCSVCGKIFIPSVEHIYKTMKSQTKEDKEQKRLFQCSYTCWNKQKAIKEEVFRASRANRSKDGKFSG